MSILSIKTVYFGHDLKDDIRLSKLYIDSFLPTCAKIIYYSQVYDQCARKPTTIYLGGSYRFKSQSIIDNHVIIWLLFFFEATRILSRWYEA